MMGWSDIFYFSIISVALVLSVMGLWFTAVMPGMDYWSKRFFLIYFSILTGCVLSSLIAIVLHYFPISSVVIYIILHLECLLLSLPLPMLTAYLLHCCQENMRSNKLFQTVLGLWVVYFVLLASTSITGGFFSVTVENQPLRGSLYPLLMLPLIAIMLINLVGAIRRRRRLSRKAFISFIIVLLPMTVSLLVMLFVDAMPLFDISFVLSALVMYSFILSDQIEQSLRHQREIARQQLENARQQREIAHQRASVMVLQMRPHFIYNTLMSIYSLCLFEPGKARQTTLDFTNYLRRNFNAIASDSVIPFSTELEHTHAYLAVEQVQFGNMLVVEWDTPFTQFRLPPLTLQPIVENAVKHGMDLDSNHLHISIRTQDTNYGAEITVEDTGPGFDPSDESKPHPSLENIRQRLEMMCGGSMTIKLRDGGGTVVTITIQDSINRKKELL
ncbi:MAG: histidine kinase [Lachnospiraceae bacterium]|nr:histidine kinase [Lachnospiraceae bacterium]